MEMVTIGTTAAGLLVGFVFGLAVGFIKSDGRVDAALRARQDAEIARADAKYDAGQWKDRYVRLRQQLRDLESDESLGD